MRQPEEVEQMLALHSLGWGTRRIAKRLGVSRYTVRRYLEKGKWLPYGQPKRASALDGLEEWLEKKLGAHRGNAEVIRQELVTEHGIGVSLRTVERAVAPFRQKMAAKARATIRYETPPGKQLQVDFGSTRVEIGDESVKVYLFVATLGFSRRSFIAAFQNEKQLSWFKGIEGAFAHFGGMTREVLIDNPKALVSHHNPRTREVTFNERFRAFAAYWGFHPKACAPYRARTKGKVENGVGYVKRNAVAGRRFASWDAFEEHLHHWSVHYADHRIHGSTGEKPIERFQREALKPLEGRPPFIMMREFSRVVHSDSCVELNTNRYSVPWEHIGCKVTVQLIDGVVKIFYKEQEIAIHCESRATRSSRICVDHLRGIIGVEQVKSSELLRPLIEYEEAIGGIS